MGLLYFKADSGVLVTMDGETSIDVSKTNKVVSSSVMSTREVSDDVIEGNLIISVQGKVTYSKTPTQEGNPTPEEWVTLIEAAIAGRTRFTLYSVKPQAGKSLLKDFPNMVIADYGYVTDRFEDTLTARITFQEVFVSDAATTTILSPIKSSAASGSYPSTTKSGKGTSTEVSEEKTSALYGVLQFSLKDE